ncbi:beta-lactam sensor/signal transducer [Sediminibacterium sp. KACHI17]|uniref:Beta-lactam sensor/signal transducer n=1 Tax=Sediminibacterium sp. KACHI17 TaxID=1751071 RepID=A0AAT9GGE5_9BACT
MLPVFQSVFLQSLGYAIANSLWQTAILWLFYLLITSVLKPRASVKYTLAVILQSIGFIWFIFTLFFYYSAYNQLVPVTAGTSGGTITTIVPPGTGFRSSILKLMIWAEQLLPYLSAAYLILMIFLSVKWIIGYRYTLQIRKEGLAKMPANWRVFVQDTARQLGITREVRIFLSEKIASPLTIGFLKPLILVPVASINHLTIAQLEAILLHELAHIKRYDYLINILLSVAEISLFFNPFTRLFSSHIRKERENSCDDWVLQFQYSASTYAEALLRMAQLQATPAFAMAAAGSHQHELLNRVKRMIGANENRFTYKKQLLSFLLVTGILSSVAWFHPEQSKNNGIAVQKNTANSTALRLKEVQPVAIEPMAVKVTNPLFNPAFFLSNTLKKEMSENLEQASREIEASLNSKEVREAIQQIPATLQGAFQKIQTEKNLELSDWKEELIKIEKAEQEMKQAYKTLDTSGMPVYVRKPFKEEFEKDMQRMEKDLQEAKLTIAKEMKATLLNKTEQEKISKEVEMAMKAVEELNLQQIIPSSLESLEKMIETFEKLDKKINPVSPPAPDKPKFKKPVVEEKLKEKERKEGVLIKEPAEILAVLDRLNALELQNEWITYPAAFSDQDSMLVKKRMLKDWYKQQLLRQLIQRDSVMVKGLKKARL